MQQAENCAMNEKDADERLLESLSEPSPTGKTQPDGTLYFCMLKIFENEKPGKLMTDVSAKDSQPRTFNLISIDRLHIDRDITKRERSKRMLDYLLR